MALRAPDVKDEHGWQVVNEDGSIAGHSTSRDKARKAAGGAKGFMVPLNENGQPQAADVVKRIDDILFEPEEAEVEKVEGTVVPSGRNLTPEEMEANAAHETNLEIKRNLDIIRGAWVDLAGALYRFKTGTMYQKLGYDSFAAYCADPDVELNATDAYGWIAVWTQLVIDRGVDPERLKRYATTKVQRVLSAVRREEVTVDEALSDVEALPRSALEDKYTGRTATKGKPDTDSTIRTDAEPALAQCPTCGKMGRMDAETGEFIR